MDTRTDPSEFVQDLKSLDPEAFAFQAVIGFQASAYVPTVGRWAREAGGVTEVCVLGLLVAWFLEEKGETPGAERIEDCCRHLFDDDPWGKGVIAGWDGVDGEDPGADDPQAFARGHACGIAARRAVLGK